MNQILDNEDFGQPQKMQFYRNFHNVENAKAFTALLDKNAIKYSLESSDVLIDRAIVGQGLVPKATLKIFPRDFKKVGKILEREIKQFGEEEIQEHYLNQLDDNELIDILKKPDEWSPEDVNIAQILLEIRGQKISKAQIEIWKKARMTFIRKGKKGSRFKMFLYFLGIVAGFFTSLIFPIAGIGMGYYYAFDKSLDVDGVSFYTFEPTTRTYGQFMFFGGIVVLFFEIVWIRYLSGGEIMIQDLFTF